MTTPLSHEVFSRHLNTLFRIHPSDHGVAEVELCEISDFQQSTETDRFWLIFRGPKDRFLSQGTYQVQHEQMGEFPLFIVPINEDQNWFYYEAVFNRLREVAAANE